MFALRGIYPVTDGGTFDFEYYRNHHMPLCMEVFGSNAKCFEVARSLPGEKYVCIGTIYLESVEEFEQSFAGEGRKITEDVKNYTNIPAVIELQEIL
jgi:uncharacterized protein (TIGR02118 family)